MNRVGLALLISLLLSGGADSLGRDPLITEFMASNTDTVLDEDGDSSDWMEIYNPGPATVDLEGWYLTDDPQGLPQWPFPGVSLQAGGYLLVFASGKDRRSPAGELHTGFRLRKEGDYLALVRPDGATVAHDFGTVYPPQRPDMSYGIGQNLNVVSLVPDAAPATVLVPENDALGQSWTGGAEPFDDRAWTRGTQGVGYVASVPGFAVRNILATTAVRSLATADQVLANPFLHREVFTETAQVVNYRGTDPPGRFGNDNALPGASLGRDTDHLVLVARGQVAIPTAGTWTFGTHGDDGFRLEVGNSLRMEFPDCRVAVDTFGVFEAPEPGDYELTFLYFHSTGHAETEIFAAPGRHTSWNTDFRLIGDTVTGGLTVSTVEGAGSGFRPLIRTDIQSPMHNVNASAYVRIPFAVEDPAGVQSLTLRLRYDDGFVAFVNGVEVTRRNAPAGLHYNSTATTDRPSHQASTPEYLSISDALPLLRAGENILALHALNDKADSPDFLIHATIADVTIDETHQGYFVEPTPGLPNEGECLDMVADTRFDPDRYFYDAPVEVLISTDTPGAEIRWTMDGSEPTPTHGSIYAGPISIEGTTILRAAAFKESFLPTNVDTHTYIFLGDAINQTGTGFPSSWNGVTADYEMDPDVVQNPLYSATIRDDLMAIPTLSIVMDQEDLFGSTRGIYANPQQEGVAWERAGSVELIVPEGLDWPGGFQIDCGVRIHGGYGRRPDYSPKHSFRFLFKGEYGATTLEYPLFPDSTVSSFDTVVCRACFDHTWFVGTGAPGNGRAQYLRDQFHRDTQLDLGSLSSHGIFVHLYMNGLYWGLYNLIERPSAPFAAAHLGGEREDWDVLKSAEVIDGNRTAWNAMMGIARSGVADPGPYAAVQEYLDVTNLADYVLLNFFTGNVDWDHHNWYAARRRERGACYQFFSWDAEESLVSITGDNRTGVNFADRPSELFHLLLANEEFRTLFADRAHRHLFNDGALTPQATADRYLSASMEIDSAIVGESARWGDTRRTIPYMRDVEWVAERQRLLQQYFPQRTQVVIGQLRAAGMYPATAAPRFSQNGGAIAPRFALWVTAPTGVVYYTLDGTDPRLHGGAVSPDAFTAQAAGGTVLIPAATEARILVPRDDSLGLNWIAPGFDDSGWIAGSTGVGYERASGYEDLIITDVAHLMYGAQTSLYLRLPFMVTDPSALGILTLRMKYDDGFVAFINGREVAAMNAPNSPRWNSTALGDQDDAQATVFESFDVSEAIGTLVAGWNVLAIHGLNVSTSSSDMLILPELEVAEGPGDPIILDQTTHVRARALAGGAWSALTEAWFRMATPFEALRLTEIMYHPPDEGGIAGDRYEFIELKNTGGDVLDVSGCTFSDGIAFSFAEGTVLDPGRFVVVVADATLFASRYPHLSVVAGTYSGKLSNAGEALTLRDPEGTVVTSLIYDDRAPWPAEADGSGYSIVPVDPDATGDPADAASWRRSAFIDGSPGSDDPGDSQPWGWQLPGDFNQDSALDISDAVSLLLTLFFVHHAPALPCDSSSPNEGGNLLLLDSNADSGVDITDVIFLLRFLFQHGVPPTLGTTCMRMEGCHDNCAQ